MLNSNSVNDAKDLLLAQAFPFNIVLNCDSEITQIGASLARIFPDVDTGNHSSLTPVHLVKISQSTMEILEK